MSSQPSGQPGPSAPKEGKGKERFSKLLSRAKTVLKRGESSKRSAAPASKPEPATKVEAVKTVPVPETKIEDARARYESIPGISKLSKAELFEERAKKLGERFGLEIKPSEWHSVSPDDTVLRIDKPIRMRVRRTCHKCNAHFNVAKECPGCQHVRCTKCARNPPKRTEAELVASRERRAAKIKANKENAPIIPDYAYDGTQVYVLKRPSKTGRQDLVYKKPRQRVRRTCHECATPFGAGTKICENCSHIRCTDCPRDPPKKDKYPFGYPGDEFGPNSVPHYECETCDALYPTGAEDGTRCTTCGTEKTASSRRAKPRKVIPELSPDALQLLEERLKLLKVAA